MKLPVIKHLQKNNSAEALQNTIDVLESFTEHRSCTDNDMDVVGELITNLCGAVEMHQMIADGMSERDAANGFAQKVLGSIDR
ncbi:MULTISPECIES: DUF6952 family protein [Leeuwenhoekiella]|jgi:uncharacterized protein YejL (UPF0352 family)|uniref:Uncharacterized protein n=2 Tax=Leeuwenhoekiella TaxID=283735 RepID=A3XMV6_LEEBM|nr:MULTISPECIES: hypothetical protein [Leeuwenhoekiella]MEC7785004.1 hypothetical protein [Bacteroidota bacterium]EAQ49113.1 hypothetical protein MED217_06906 [Leeuwenhoekiella blandensis MED217]MAO45433.1 hypothetical protein [Leeuwenhoekiella sp.]MBQ51589.1 hypothetical protein [Leeuwenhoekiella sp.]MEC8682613.1 hypothetical protein [Bacteroidota bacterium]|tara:strand:+ start:242 stop:490 length:249 start_codon:yes stop_codon:yes gene_type:complete